MGQMSTSSIDLAITSGTLVTGTLDATGSSSNAVFAGNFNVTLSGTWTGTALIQRSFDAGTTWFTASVDGLGTAASYTTNASVVLYEPERGVFYKIAWTRSSGSLVYRLSQTTGLIFNGNSST